MANNIIAVNIGPIYGLMQGFTKTRHIWGASYLFSYLMKSMAADIISDASLKNKLVLPYVDNDKQSLKVGTGLYADRLILQNVTEGDFEKIVAIKVGISKKILDNETFPASEKRQQYQSFLDGFLQIYILEMAIEEKKNIVLGIAKHLDTCELMPKPYNPTVEMEYGKLIDELNGRIFYKDGFEKPRKGVPTVEMITTADLNEIQKIDLSASEESNEGDNNISDFTDGIIDRLKADDFYKKHFKNYHKYMAVVQADGDRIGELIGKAGNDKDQLNAFSKALFKFAKKAAEIVSSYGFDDKQSGRALPVYIGGDDLLFFAPVAYKKGAETKTVFDLVADIDTKFKSTMEPIALKYGIEAPSLSFGISINYYKFPLNEMREEAYRLLMGKAKNKQLHPDKNCIEFILRKHSGQKIGFGIEKSKIDSYESFRAIVRAALAEDNDFFNSLTYKLPALATAFNMLGKQRTRVDAIFSNYLNDEFHSGKEDYQKLVKNHIVNMYSDYPEATVQTAVINEKQERTDTMAKIYASLRFAHFINSNENDN